MVTTSVEAKSAQVLFRSWILV